MAVTFKLKAELGSNQPEWFHVQLTARAYWHVRPTNYRVAVLKPKIDRLAITFDIADPSSRTMVRAHLIELAKAEHSLSTWTKAKGWGAAKYDLAFRADLSGHPLLIQCAPVNSAVSLLRFEFNPEKAGLAGVKTFEDLLPHITCGLATYPELTSAGTVTRADVAVDLVNIDIEDVLIRTAKPGVTSGYFGPSGKAQTKYLNVTSKGSKLYVYDRKAHLEKKAHAKGPSGSGSGFGSANYTRVEVRVLPNVPIQKLPTLQNRLTKIDLIDIEAAEPPEETHHWKLFQDACRYRGLAGALALLPEKLRASYEAAIDATGTSLWQPDVLWAMWPEALEKVGLLPAN